MPLIVCLMAACMLSEKVTGKDGLVMLFVFTSVVLVIAGA